MGRREVWPTAAEAAADPALCRTPGEVEFIRIIREADEDERADIVRFVKRLAGGASIRESGVEYLRARGCTEDEAQRLADQALAGVVA
ncbi:MAG: hypothetical protein ACRYHQ_03360 [Janthinobacterium lividum]